MGRPRKLLTKECETCGTAVTRKPSDFREHVFCSHKCYSSSSLRRRMTMELNESLPERVARTCPTCQKAFDLPPSRVLDVNFCSRECRTAARREEGRRFLNANGYAIVGVPADYPGARRNGNYGQIFEHRKVMQDMLGRPLLPEENVHHKNGVRDDNRPENLELWTRSQPSGQRVEDKIRWAREFLQQYEGLSI